MKEQLINDVLLRMQEIINREQLRVLEQVLLAVMYSVDVVRMETALSTELDDNQYMLDTIKLNMQKRDLSDKTIDQYMRASRMFLDTVHKNLRNVVPTDIEYYLNEFARGKLKVNSPRVSIMSGNFFLPFLRGYVGVTSSPAIRWKMFLKRRFHGSRLTFCRAWKWKNCVPPATRIQ